MLTLALRTLTGLVPAAALTLVACSETRSPGPDDRVTINSNGDDLSTQVETKDEPIEVQATGAANAAVLVTNPGYALSLVAEVAPPEIDGVPLQATSVAFHDGLVLVSYNMAGEVQQGAVDVFVIDQKGGLERQPVLTSRATFADADVNAVGSFGGRAYLATATADEAFGTPAVLEALAVTPDGQLALDGHVRVGLSSYAATSVAFGAAHVFVTSGDTGGLFVFNPASGAIVRQAALDDARWVAAPGDGTVVALQGTPGRVAVLAEADLAPLAEHPFAGAQIPESKSTIEVVGGKAFIAAGPGGTIVMDVATGAVITQIPVPLGLPFDAADIVTNAVSVDGDLVFMSNGAAGVFMATASDALAKPFDPEVPPSFELVGQLAFPDGVTSVNHIAYRDGFLFVATGKGGLKIVRVDATLPTADPPTGYPYVTTFDDAAGRAGWVMSGAWGFGVPDGARVGRDGEFLDNNPAVIDQYNLSANQIALFDVPLAIPLDGVPVVHFAYNAEFVHADDKVELQLEDPATGAWATKVTFDRRHQRAGLTDKTFYLADYRGKTTRLRFRQTNGKAQGARRFIVDDLSVGSLELPTLAWPFSTSFETDNERGRWNLEGAWAWAAGDAFEGETALDANPEGKNLDGYNVGQVAALEGFVPVPIGGRPVFGFWYRTDLVHESDKIDVDLQIEGESTWHDLVRFTPRKDHAGWTYREVSLAGHAGKRVRVRLVLELASTGTLPRRFAVDALRFGELAGPDLGYPYGCDFEGACASDWVTEGMLDVRPTDPGMLVGADPLMLGASDDGHEVRMLGFVPVPATGGTVLGFRAELGFIHPSDKLTVDVQDLATGQWLTLRTYGYAHARGWADYELALDGFAGRVVRLRFRTVYGAGVGARAVAIDDVRVAGHSEVRFAFPWDAAIDAAGAADWVMTGTWQPGPDGFDANPLGAGLASQSDGHDLIMAGYVDVPAAGRPTLFAGLDLVFTDPNDKAYLELQIAGQGAWTRLRTYTSKHNRDGLGWDELSLGQWAGKAVRVRVRFAFASTTAPRRLVLGGLRFEDLALPERGYPWANGFDGKDELADWSLWGAWAQAPSDEARKGEGGDAYLDGNPGMVAQYKWEELQTATLGHTVVVPANGPAWLGFQHHFGAVHKDDRLRLEVQTAASAAWATLATLSSQHLRDGWASLELSLDGFRGKSIRLRFVMVLGASDVVRPIGVDQLWIGERQLPTIAAPYDRPFAGVASDPDWALHGTWGYDGAALRSNPTLRDTANFQSLHTATLEGLIDLSGFATPVLELTHTLALVDTNDRAYVEVLTPDTNVWTAIASLKKADNVAAPTTRQYSLTAYAGQQIRLRLRVASASSTGARDFVVQRLYVGAP